MAWWGQNKPIPYTIPLLYIHTVVVQTVILYARSEPVKGYRHHTTQKTGISRYMWSYIPSWALAQATLSLYYATHPPSQAMLSFYATNPPSQALVTLLCDIPHPTSQASLLRYYATHPILHHIHHCHFIMLHIPSCITCIAVTLLCHTPHPASHASLSLYYATHPILHHKHRCHFIMPHTPSCITCIAVTLLCHTPRPASQALVTLLCHNPSCITSIVLHHTHRCHFIMPQTPSCITRISVTLLCHTPRPASQALVTLLCHNPSCITCIAVTLLCHTPRPVSQATLLLYRFSIRIIGSAWGGGDRIYSQFGHKYDWACIWDGII